MTDTPLRSAWAWGAYRQGMGRPPFNHYRITFAVMAIKHELVSLGYADIDLTSAVFGPKLDKAVKKFQGANGLVVDGFAGQKTCNALWRERIVSANVPEGWLRAQLHWESGDDPGAEFTNPDGSRDRGLTQLNSSSKPATDEEAFDPAYSIPYLADFQKDGAKRYDDCGFFDVWRLAVGRWRTPVGADEWCKRHETVPDPDGSWAEKAAYYVSRVNTDGRMNWVG